MKTMLILIIIFLSYNSYGATYHFLYQKQPLKLEMPDHDFIEGLKEAAKKCMDYYTEGEGPKVGEEIWLDLIDVCVNPRKTPIKLFQ